METYDNIEYINCVHWGLIINVPKPSLQLSPEIHGCRNFHFTESTSANQPIIPQIN